MILYSSTVKNFFDDIANDKIALLLNESMKKNLFKHSSESEKNSWINSFKYMADILKKAKVPNDCTVALEYNLPMTDKRIDFMLLGYDTNRNKTVILFELKQWSGVEKVENSDLLIETYVGNGIRKVVHPAYQVWSYQELINDFNRNVQENDIKIISCVVLHNYLKKEDDNLFDSKFSEYLDKVKIFTKSAEQQLIQFISENISFGDNLAIINEIENSELSPSKKLQDNINSLLNGNSELKLIDEQIEIYESINTLIPKDNKQVIIVEGGPGTGKSVIAVNLLSNFTSKGKLCQYVSRNTAPRVIYSYKLKGIMTKTSIDNLFKTSGSYTKTESNTFDVLIVDEAHCLTEKSGLFSNYGVNQIKEIINSSKCSIFFIDEKQKVHLNDIGTKSEIEKWANFYNANVSLFKLESQFRCNGSNDYLRLVDNILNNVDEDIVSKINYDVSVVDTPFELERIIKEKNATHIARILAGYCWDWNKKEMDNPNYHDIKIEDYEISWNLGADQTYAIDDSINEVGCVHSVQGLEFDYVGVIIGNDMYYEAGQVKTSSSNHASTDPAFKGIKKMHKENSEYAYSVADEIIKNTYRVLLTRGIKGCYIYCVDKKLNDYVKQKLEKYRFQ